MKRSNFTSYYSRCWTTLSAMLLVFLWSMPANAQNCTMGCNDNVQVSVGSDCKAKITYDLILEDPNNSSICTPNGPQAFVVQVMDHEGKVIASTGSDKDYVTCEDVLANGSNTFRVKVKHWATQNSCWGSITVEDKINPKLYCKDVDLWCNEPFTPNYIETCRYGQGYGYPEVRDNCDELRTPVSYPNPWVTCGEIDLRYEDRIVDEECDGEYSAVIYRTWTATDASGNSASCVQRIYLHRLSLHQINFPPDYTGLPGDKDPIYTKKSNDCSPNTDPGLVFDGECADGEGNAVPGRHGNGGMTDEPTGFPMKHGIPVAKYVADGSGLNIGYSYPWDSYGFCELNVTYKDHIIPVCVGSYKIIREWKVVDWCTPSDGYGNNIRRHTQTIKVVDKEASIDCPEDVVLGTNTNPKECEADFRIPDAKIWEACGEVAKTKVTIYGTRFVTHPHPTWATEEYVVHEGYGEVEGSATGDPVTVDFGSVKLPGPTCDEEFAKYRVVYWYIDHCGNEAHCQYNVFVYDDTPPTPVCDEITQVTVDENCEAHVFAETFDDGSHDNCDKDLTFLVRRMEDDEFKPHVKFDEEDVWKTAEGTPCIVVLRVIDCHGNYADCMVQVLVDDKTPPTIEVEDVTIYCDQLDNNGEIPADLIPEPETDDNCPGERYELIDVSDWRNECYIGTVIYTYIAVDRHDLESDPVEQIVTVADRTPLEVDWPDDYIAYCTAEDGSGFQDPLDPDVTGRPILIGDDCELVGVSYEDHVLTISDESCFKIVRVWTVYDWCANPYQDHPSEGEFMFWEQYIKVIDDVPPLLEAPADEDVCIDGTDDCFTQVPVGAPWFNDCSSDVRVRAEWVYTPDDWYCGVAASGTEADASKGFIAGPFEPGVLTITFIADDGCNNVTKDETVLTIIDCKLPTPYCEEIITTLMPSTGEVVIWASDFDKASFDNCDNCADPDDLIFSFSPDIKDLSKTFDCSTTGSQKVEIWVTDHAGNQDFCTATAYIQTSSTSCLDSGGSTESMAGVSGKISNVSGESIESVTVAVNGSSEAMPTPAVTGASGEYAFNLHMGGDYTITPEKDMNPLNGVSTFDLVLLRKHVLGTDLLDSPYKLIAADVNNSGSITTFDMVELRKVVLQIESSFTNNTSWRFIDSNYEFTSEDPLTEKFAEIYNINNLSEDMKIDFVAVKVGDLNGNAIPNSLLGAEVRNTTGTLNLNVADRFVKAGETVTVEFAADLANTSGYQFTMHFNGLQMIDLVEGVAKAENFNTNLAQRGVLTTSWNGAAADEVLFGLTFKATTSGQLSELLSLSSDYTAAEAYNTDNELLNVNIQFNTTEIVTARFELYQNTPNPFAGETLIGFNLPEAGEATFKVLDVQGKVLKQVTNDYAKGYNQISLDARSLNATGVLYYQLESADNVATKKMIIID